MSNWRKGLTNEKQAIIQYFRETHPVYSNAESFEDIKYQELAPAECLEILSIFKQQIKNKIENAERNRWSTSVIIKFIDND